MEVIRFLLFSSLEWFALFVLTFAMFKFPYRGYWGQLILCSVLLSFISYVLFDALNMRPIAPIIQLPLVILCTWQIFRVHLFYAAIMTTFSYNCYAFLQSLYIVIMKGFGLSFEEVVSTPYSYILQPLTIGSTVLLGWIIYKRRVGFTFVPDFEHIRVKLRGINLWLLLLVVLGNANVAVFDLLAKEGLEALLLSTAVVLILFYFARKKEYMRE